jgi:hypothetical protein
MKPLVERSEKEEKSMAMGGHRYSSRKVDPDDQDRADFGAEEPL